MTRTAFVPILAGLLTSCATLPSSYPYWAEFQTILEEVERPADSRQRWGETRGILPTDSAGFTYSDELVEAVIVAGADGFHFNITNVSEHTIRLVWDEAAYVGPDGSVDRVMHYGMKYADRNSSTPASVIPRGSRLEDGAFPTRRVELAPAGLASEWIHHALLTPDETVLYGSVDGSSAQAFRQRAGDNVGRRIGLLLPLEVEGILNEYTFWFRVTDVRFGSGPKAAEVEEAQEGWARFADAPFDTPTWAGFVAQKDGKIAYPLIPTCAAWYHLKKEEAQFLRTVENVRLSGLVMSQEPGCTIR